MFYMSRGPVSGRVNSPALTSAIHRRHGCKEIVSIGSIISLANDKECESLDKRRSKLETVRQSLLKTSKRQRTICAVLYYSITLQEDAPPHPRDIDWSISHHAPTLPPCSGNGPVDIK